MVWGSAAKGIDEFIDKLRQNNSKLTSLHILRFRRLDDAVRVRSPQPLLFSGISSCMAHKRGAFRKSIETLQWNCAAALQGVQSLCSALRENQHLTELTCSSHSISRSAAAAFGDMLATNTSLRTISIGNSTLGDEVGYL
jgi:hypothetical protein